MARDARETKMHYSPSEKDGVFVVEVARGADSTVNNNSCNGKLNSEKLHIQTINENHEIKLNNSTKKIARDDGTILNNEDVQIHAPPPDGASDDELLTIDEDGAVSLSSQKCNGDDSMRPVCGSTNTGLSQSDLSITSSCGSNQGYSYGTQQHYTVDAKGYQSSSPHYVNEVQLKSNHSPISNSKPIITAAIFKQDSVDPSSSYPEDGRPGKLRTDKNALNTPAEIQSTIVVAAAPPPKEEVLIEEQRKLGNGVLTAIAETNGEANEETNGETNEDTNAETNGETITKTNGELNGKTNGGPIINTTEKITSPEKQALESVETGFDSLINLPAPPSVDEIKQLSDLTLSDNNNMDSLPPPPPPEVIVDGPPNGES